MIEFKTITWYYLTFFTIQAHPLTLKLLPSQAYMEQPPKAPGLALYISTERAARAYIAPAASSIN